MPKLTSSFQFIQDQLKWVDLVFEVRDARLPQSSRHPQINKLCAGKPRLVVLAKRDLADPGALSQWLSQLSHEPNQAAFAIDLKGRHGKEKLIAAAHTLTKAKRQALLELFRRPLRACVVGIPNVGKSSLVNWLIGRRKTLVGNKPGITRGPQWVKIHQELEELELLDTPGILPPTGFQKSVALKLALLNLLPESTYNVEDVAYNGMTLLRAAYPHMLEHYGLTGSKDPPTLDELAIAKNCLKSGGKPDSHRAARLFLHDLRKGTLGRIILD